MARRPNAASCVLERGDLVRELAAARRSGETIAFTNGCFDLLHVGHLATLQAAAAEADRLVVGLNRDDSVRRLKGPGRPIFPFEERALLLASLEPVDWVVGFDDETPRELIEAVCPDVLVKGGDWPVEKIVGREAVERRGGRVITVPLAPGHSTTTLIGRIRGAGRER